MTIYHESITVNAVVYTTEVYGGLAACLAYLVFNSTPAGDAFNDLDTDDQIKKLSDATRYLDRQIWQGSPTTPAVGGTTLAWPRVDVEILIGDTLTPVDSTTVPVDIVHAAFEMAAILAASPDASSQLSQGNNVKSLRAGSAAIDYWAPLSTRDGTATVLPVVVEALVSKYQGSASSSTATLRGGQWNDPSDCGIPNDYKRYWPF